MDNLVKETFTCNSNMNDPHLHWTAQAHPAVDTFCIRSVSVARAR